MSTVATEAKVRKRVSRPGTVLALISAAHGMSHMYAALLPLTFPFIVQEMGVGYTEIGLMMGSSAVVGGLLQFAWGYAGRLAPRPILIGTGNILLGLSTAFGALAPTFFIFTMARWAAVISTSPQHPVGNSMIADQYGRTRRGFALAINYAGGNAGTLLVPLIGVLLLIAFGWRQMMLLFAVPSLLVGILVMAVIRDPRQLAKSEPGRRGSAALWETRQLLLNRTFLLLMAASLMAAGGRGLGIVLNFVPAYLADPTKGLGLPEPVVGVLYGALLVGSVVGPLLFGRFSDKIGARKPLILAVYLLSAVGAVTLASVGGQVWLLGPVLLFFGLVVFSESSLIQALLTDVTRAGSRDIMFGTYFALGFGISAGWVVFQGWLVDTYGFGAMFGVMAASYVAAALLILAVRERRATEGDEAS